MTLIRQRTINQNAYAIGVGVHCAQPVRMTLRPANSGGIRFLRTDVAGAKPVRVSPENVCDTTLATSVGTPDASISTVEHLLFALWGVGVDHVLVELDSREVPILDGSAISFIELLHGVGLHVLDDVRRYIRIKREIKVEDGPAMARLIPHDGFRASYTFVHDHHVFDRYPKRITLDFDDIDYVHDLAPARSFGLVSDLPKAQAINRCLASSERNSVGIDDDGIVNEDGLRFRDEFVKHKILDAIGDIYQLGHPVIGAFEGYMSGHTLNNTLVKALVADQDAWEFVTREKSLAEGIKPQLTLG